MRLEESVIKNVLAGADIVQIVGHYVPLIKKGKNYTCVCPFHDDHNPSMVVSSDKQMYKCFVCGNGGNAFKFVQEFEHVSFPEAVLKVAEISGNPLDFVIETRNTKVDTHLKQLYDVLNETIKYTKYTLNSANGKDALEYLNKRGLSHDIINKFDIGYNDANDSLTRFLTAKKYDLQNLVEANVSRNTSSGIHDVFNSRITFPIHDNFGNPVGFTARTMIKGESKYINTSETSIYVKGNLVYNYHRARQAIKQSGLCIVAEGVMDVIALTRAGILNAVATLGTSCTLNQLKLIKQCTNNIVFCYDGDDAGQAATYKAGKLALEAGFNVQIIKNTVGLDPDEIIAKYGAEQLQTMIQKPIAWMQFVFDYMKKKYDLTNYTEKKEFAKQVKAEIDVLSDDYDRQNFLHELTLLTGYRFNETNYRVNHAERRIVDSPVISAIDKTTASENLILSQMLLSKKASELFKENIGFLLSEYSQKLAVIIVDTYRKCNKLKVNELISAIEDEKIQNMVVNLTMNEALPAEYDEKIMLGAITKLKTIILEDKVSDIKQKISQISNPDSQRVLMDELYNLQLERRRLIEKE